MADLREQSLQKAHGTAKTSLPTREIGEIRERVGTVVLLRWLSVPTPFHSNFPNSNNNKNSSAKQFQQRTMDSLRIARTHTHTHTASVKEEKHLWICVALRSLIHSRNCVCSYDTSGKRTFQKEALFLFSFVCNGRRRFRLLRRSPVTCPMFAVFCPLNTLRSFCVYASSHTLFFHFSSLLPLFHGGCTNTWSRITNTYTVKRREISRLRA